MAGRPHRARRLDEQFVACYCYSECTLGVGPPVQRIARVRARHLELDRERIQQALARGLQPTAELTRAVQLNEMAIDAWEDDEEERSNTNRSEDEAEQLLNSQDSAASRRVLSWAASLSDHGHAPHSQRNALSLGARDDDENFAALPRPSPSPPSSSRNPQDEDVVMELAGLDRSDTRPSSSRNPQDEDVVMELAGLDRSDTRSLSARAVSEEGATESTSSQTDDEEVVDDEMEDILAGFGLVDGDGDGEEGQDEENGDGRQEQDEAQAGDDDELPPMEPGPSSTHAQGTLDRLVGAYRHGPRPVDAPGDARRILLLDDLPPDQQASLRHFRTTVRRKLTDRASKEVAANVEHAVHSVAPNVEFRVMSKYKCAKFVSTITKLKTHRHDMCPNSCMAFVGEHANRERCNARRDGEVCGAPHYDVDRKPLRQFTTIELLPRVRVRYAVGAYSNYAPDRLTASSATIGQLEHLYQDYWDGQQAMDLHWQKGIFVNEREEAYSISVDGVQVEDRKESNAWIVVLTCLSTPPKQRYRRSSSFISCIIPGPKHPVDIDSFLEPVVQEFARASKGFWIWDGPEREWFLWRAYLVFAGADQPGSQKINRMTGTSGFSGCRDCHMIANYSGANQVAGYYPLGTTGKHDAAPLNRNRPDEYDPYELPLRTDATYAEALEDWDACLTDAEYAQVRRDHGVSGRPLLAASPAFSCPWFFPSDIFHLFGINLPSLLWSTLTDGEPGDPFTFSDEQKVLFAETIQCAGTDLPASFSSGLPRDPFQFASSHYKMFEWSLVTYNYLLPFLFAIGAPVPVINMINQLQQGVYLASADGGCTEAQRRRLQQHFVGFVDLWEANYVRGHSSLVHRSTISVHYLLHICDFIRMHGSVRISSQARCEREAGLMKDDIRSRKNVFENISNTLILREHLRLLDILIDGGDDGDGAAGDADVQARFRMTVRIRRDHRQLTRAEQNELGECVQALEDEGLVAQDRSPIVKRGRIELPSGRMIRGSVVEGKNARRCCRFMARHGEEVIYGEALLFFCFPDNEDAGKEAEIFSRSAFVLARPLQNVEHHGGIVRGTGWGQGLFVLDAAAIVEPVGILHLGGFIYVLRKLSWVDSDE